MYLVIATARACATLKKVNSAFWNQWLFIIIIIIIVIIIIVIIT